MEISELNKYLINISLSGYLDFHSDEMNMPDHLKELTPYATEIELIHKCKKYLVSGRISKAHSIINDLQNLKSFRFMPFETVDRNDVLAYVNYECALFYRIVDDSIAYSNFLKIAKLLAKSPEINLLIDYQFATINAFNSLKTNELQKFTEIFHQEELYVLEIMAYSKIGEIQAALKQYSQAREYFVKSKAVIQKIHSVNLEITADSNIGYVYFLDSDYQRALDIFNRIKDCNDYFQKSLILENIALIYEVLGDYAQALDYWMESLSICQDHGIMMNIPEDTLHIGEIYEEHLDSVSKAKFFYKMGYDHSMQMFKDGINLSGNMRIVIEKYISYFAEYYIPDDKMVNKQTTDPFAFAVDKSWKHITEIFQFNVIVYYKFNCDSVYQVLDILQLKRSNFQAKQQKLTNLGYQIPDFRKKVNLQDNSEVNSTLQDYIRNLSPMDWKNLNKRFENDILKYLINHYGSHKREFLVKKLSISYPNLKRRLDSLE